MSVPCPACGAPSEPENWFRIESKNLGFIFHHRGLISRKTLAQIIRAIKYGLRKKELLK